MYKVEIIMQKTYKIEMYRNLQGLECIRNLQDCNVYSLNAVQWESTLLGVILGSLCFGVEIHSQTSEIHSKVVVWMTLLRVDSTILSMDFHSKWSDP